MNPSLRDELRDLVNRHKESLDPKPLRPGTDFLPASGKVVGAEEFSNLLEASADLFLTAGRFSQEFEKQFAKIWCLSSCLLVNSGSSANLLAFSALRAPELKERQVKPGDEFVTAACGFPTTIAPAIQQGLTPVFVDVEVPTYNPSIESIISAITPKTKLIMLAHTLGNPYRADRLLEVCKERGIWLIEDCCDAFGAKIDGKPAGTLGDFATCSFYPAHQLTMGEGGAVLTSNKLLSKIALSLRDWGRDCWCEPGCENTCGARFSWKLGDLPRGFDHKYIYSRLGYNLKVTDFQAAIGLAQLKRATGFIQKRIENHATLTALLKSKNLDRYFILPEATPGTEPSWFGFFLLLREAKEGLRLKFLQDLQKRKIGTRMLFGGNMTRQPALSHCSYKVAEPLINSDKIMNDGFWVGIWPGFSTPHLEYIADCLADCVRKYF